MVLATYSPFNLIKMLYISDRVVSFSLLVNGKSKRFRFDGRMRGGSYYVARTDEEINALEGSDMFGRIYHRSPSEEPVKRKRAAKVKEPKQVLEVSSWQDAQEYLMSNYSVDSSQLQTPDAILSAASSNHVSFPNLK